MQTNPKKDPAPRLHVTIAGVGLLLLPLIYNPLGGAFLPVKRVILYGMVAALGLAWMLLLRRSDMRWRTTPGMLLGLTYTTVALTSVFWSTNRFSTLVEATQLIALLTIFVFTLNTLDIHDFSIITRYVAAAGGLVAVVGILQYFTLDLAILEAAGLRHLRIPSAGLPSGTFSFRNTTASFLIGSMPLALLAWHTDPDHKRKHIWFAATIAMAVLLIFTRTRGAWLGIVAGTMVSTLYLMTQKQSPFDAIRRKPIQAIAIVFTVLVVSQLSPGKERSPQPFDVVKDSATTALTSIADIGADRGRFTFWGNTLRMISDHPVLGVGFGNWEYHYPSYDRHRKWHTSNSEPVRPHNDVLWIWSELGPLGLFGFLGFVGLTLFHTFKSRSGHKEDAYLAAACMASTVALFVHGGFSFLREQPAASLLLWMSLAGLSIPLATMSIHRVPRLIGPVVVLLGAFAVWLGISHVRFDYAYHLAKQQYDRTDLHAAHREISRAIDNGMFDHRAAFLDGRILQSAGQLPQAAAAYRKALEYHPNYVNTLHNLGGVLAAQGQRGSAISYFRQALTIRPSYHEARLNLANELVRENQFTDAKAEAARVIQAKDELPESFTKNILPNAYSLMGAILLYEKDPQNAALQLERAIALKPNFAEAYNNLAMAYQSINQPAHASRAYRMVLKHWKGDPSYLESVRHQISILDGETK